MSKSSFREGAKAALPIVLGYLPVGITFGILARKAGLTSFEVGLMSLFVYAGASQFLAIEMISEGVPECDRLSHSLLRWRKNWNLSSLPPSCPPCFCICLEG